MTEETRNRILDAKAKYPKSQSAVIASLYAVQDEQGYVTDDGMQETAKLLEVPYADVAAVATFYTLFYREPVGKYVIDVCRTISCALMGAERIIDYIADKLEIKVGETTSDGLFTLREVECLGDCGNGPVMQIGDTYYNQLTPEKVDNILAELREKGGVK